MRILLSLILFLLLAQSVLGQLVYELENHFYVVDDLENYKERIIIEGRNDSDHEETVGFLVNESADLLSYRLYQRKGSKWKPSNLTKEVTISTIDRSSFFTGTRYYYLPIPAGMEFRLEFSTKEKHTMFLTKCYKSGWFDASVVSYDFVLPDNLRFTSRTGDEFEGTFEINQSNYIDETSISYLIHPKDTGPIAYFGNWFEERINPQLLIDPSVIPSELHEIEKTGSRLELAKACFQFVQREIKYIDIENGINAIIPRQCEKVLKNGLGDCKDMATLLTALYRHFGFEAYSAISRTNSKDDVFDFPSMGLANHTICALKFSDEWYFLDATEDACLFGDASIQILGTEVFLVGYDGEPFLQVDKNPRSNCRADLNYVLHEDMSLELEMKTFGKMNHFLFHTNLKEKNPSEVIKSVLDQISGVNWQIQTVSIEDSVSLITASANMSANMYSKMGRKNLYNLKFLPTPRIMVALFQNSSFPRFSGEVHLSLDFGGEIRSDFSESGADGLEIKESDKELIIKCTFEPENDVEEFKNNELNTAWEKLIKQPLLIGYEP